MAFCHGKKAANSYVGFIAIGLVSSQLLRGGLLTSYEVSRTYCFKKKNSRGKIIVSRIIYG